MLKIGDRVTFKPHPDMRGTVIRIHTDSRDVDQKPVSYRVRWDDEHESTVDVGQLVLVPPAPFSMKPERAEEIRKTIWAHHGHTKLGRDLTGDEHDEVCRFWAGLPGTTSFYDAVSRMAKGEHLK